MTAIVRALDAVVVEQGQAESVLYARGSGFPLSVVDFMLGSNVEGQLRTAELAADRDLASLAPSLREQLLGELKSVRGSMDGDGAMTEKSVGSQYEQIESTLDGVAASTLASVEEKMLLTSGSATVSRALLALGWCFHLVQAAAAQARDDTATFFGTPTARKEAAVQLAQDNALFEEAGQQLAQSGSRAWPGRGRRRRPTRRSVSTTSSWSTEGKA